MKRKKKYLKIQSKAEGQILIEFSEDTETEELLHYLLALFAVVMDKYSRKEEDQFVLFFQMLSELILKYGERAETRQDMFHEILDNSGLTDNEIKMAQTFGEQFACKYRDLIIS